MMSGFQSHQIFIFLLNLVMAVLISSWQLGVILACLDIAIAVFIFQYFMGDGVMLAVQNAMPISLQLGYGLLLFSSLLIAVRSFKQANQDLTSENEYLSVSYQQASKELVRSLEAEDRFVKALDVEKIKELERTADSNKALFIVLDRIKNFSLPDYLRQDVDKIQTRLSTTAKYLRIVVHRATAYLQLHPQRLSIKQLINEVFAAFQSKERVQVQRVLI